MALTFWQEEKSPFRWRRLAYMAAFLWLGRWLWIHDYDAAFAVWKVFLALWLGLSMFGLVLVGIQIFFPSFFDKKKQPDRDEEPQGL